MKSKKAKNVVAMLLAISLFSCTSQIVFADKAQAAFGSESYTPEAGVSFPMGIYINADEAIGNGEIVVKYDPEMLEYVTGGELVEEGTIRLNYENAVGNQVRQDIQLLPKTGGKTIVQIAKAEATGIQGNAFEVTEMQKVPVYLPVTDGCKLKSLTVNGTDVSQEDLEKNSFQTKVDYDIEKLDIQAIAQEGSNVTIENNTLKEGRNVVKISVNDAWGNKAIYKMVITRQEKPKTVNDEEKDKPVLQPETKPENQENTKVENTFQKKLLLVAGIFILLELFICCFIGIRMYQRKKKRRKKQQMKAKKKQIKHNLASVPEEKQENQQKNEQISSLNYINDEINTEQYDIQVKDVTMTFRIVQNASSSIKEYVIKKIKKQNKYRDFSALKNISFNIKKGEVVGIIGTNGSGKSTMLKIISGALRPTSGSVEVDRDKIQLLTLGTGFDYELTGRENVYLNGAIIGYTKEYIDEKYDEIVEFAELKEFMDEKVKNYSSGMVSRLGFAIATMRDTPEILILDEVLSVGDMFFRKKSEARIKEMIHGGSTVIIVSHSMDVIRKNCDTVIWIEKGELKLIGSPKRVCPAYARLYG